MATNDNKNKAIQAQFKKMFFKITRILCVGFGPFKLDDLLSIVDKEGFAEVPLPHHLHAKFLSRENDKLLSKTNVVDSSSKS